mmetsp:Transcript_23496/g.59303  ORF Transcript_23496/g.59303 Transcript_23496/m.59303 type:complete len:357 (-) Transcript_23496:170-1240(-)
MRRLPSQLSCISMSSACAPNTISGVLGLVSYISLIACTAPAFTRSTACSGSGFNRRPAVMSASRAASMSRPPINWHSALKAPALRMRSRWRASPQKWRSATAAVTFILNRDTQETQLTRQRRPPASMTSCWHEGTSDMMVMVHRAWKAACLLSLPATSLTSRYTSLVSFMRSTLVWSKDSFQRTSVVAMVMSESMPLASMQSCSSRSTSALIPPARRISCLPATLVASPDSVRARYSLRVNSPWVKRSREMMTSAPLRSKISSWYFLSYSANCARMNAALAALSLEPLSVSRRTQCLMPCSAAMRSRTTSGAPAAMRSAQSAAEVTSLSCPERSIEVRAVMPWPRRRMGAVDAASP